MFFEANGKKILLMLTLTFFILTGVLFSLIANKNLQLSENAQIMTRNAKARIIYSYYKVRMFLGGNEQALAIVYDGNEPQTALSVPVLVYHGVPTEGSGSVPLDKFIDQMFALKENGWRTITLEEFKSFMKGQTEVPDKSFLLTFDDGRKDTFYPAEPVLEDMGFKAVMFVITGQSVLNEESYSTSGYYLSKLELKKMIESGRWDLESHGKLDHSFYPIDLSGKEGLFLSNKLWLAELGRLETRDEYLERVSMDLYLSKQDIEQNLGEKVTTFAFPYGDYGQDSLNYKESEFLIPSLVNRYYDLAFFQIFKSKGDTFNYPDLATFMIKRIEPLPEWGGEELISELNAGRAKTLPYYNQKFSNEWRESWGQAKIGEDLDLSATEGTNGASAFLDGTYLWGDYHFTVNLDWIAGSDVLLAARQLDNDNHYLCDFSSQGEVRVKERVRGELLTVAARDFSISIPATSLSLSIGVVGNTVKCYVDDRLAAQAEMNGRLRNGSVAILLWDDTMNISNVSVNFVEATEI